jgi:hypothetical protein
MSKTLLEWGLQVKRGMASRCGNWVFRVKRRGCMAMPSRLHEAVPPA